MDGVAFALVGISVHVKHIARIQCHARVTVLVCVQHPVNGRTCHDGDHDTGSDQTCMTEEQAFFASFSE